MHLQLHLQELEQSHGFLLKITILHLGALKVTFHFIAHSHVAFVCVCVCVVVVVGKG